MYAKITQEFQNILKNRFNIEKNTLKIGTKKEFLNLKIKLDQSIESFMSHMQDIINQFVTLEKQPSNLIIVK